MPPVLGKESEYGCLRASRFPAFARNRLFFAIGERKMGKIFRGFIFSLCLLVPAATSAGPLADQKLLDFLKANGALTEQQVVVIKETLDQESQKEARQQAQKEAKAIKVEYKDGFRIATGDKSFEMRLGGLIQTDLVVFGQHYPLKNDFDIRRARLFVEGRVYQDFQYRLEAELEGSSSDRLVDAYINYDYLPWMQLRMGQFKEPFSLEQLIADKNLPLNERSFAYYLTPARDVGFMVHGNFFDDAVQYGIGVFNGDGTDANRRGQKDDKQVTGRLVFKPLQHLGPDFLKSLQIGGSCSYARLDTSDFNIKVKTPARTTFFTVQPRAKFHMTEEINDLNRYGAELAYTLGPVVIMSEFIKNKFSDVKLSDTEPFNFSMQAWYAEALVMLTGERPELKNGLLDRIRPRHDFNPRTGSWGAWGLAFMYQQFKAENIVYESLVNQGYSVNQAKSFTVGLNWYLNSMVRMSVNYSMTRFDTPLYLGSNSTGKAYYDDIEEAWVTRLQLEF
jgi:phosphate-selective porin OprO and OprP